MNSNLGLCIYSVQFILYRCNSTLDVQFTWTRILFLLCFFPSSSSYLSSSSSSPSLTKLQLARESLELATRLLSMPTVTTDATASQRHMVAGTLKPFRDSPKNKLKAHTGVLNRPKTAPGERVEEHVECTQSDNTSVLQGVASKVAKVKSTKKVTRTSTFKSKDRDREKEKEKDKGGGGSHTAAEASEGAKIQEQLMSVRIVMQPMCSISTHHTTPHHTHTHHTTHRQTCTHAWYTTVLPSLF